MGDKQIKKLVENVAMLAKGFEQLAESVKLLKSMHDDLADYVLESDQKLIDQLKKITGLTKK